MKYIVTLLAFILLTFSCEKEETRPNGKIIDISAEEIPAIAEKLEITIQTNLVKSTDLSTYNHTYDVRIYLPAAFVKDKNLPIIYLKNDNFDENSILVQSSSILFDKAVASVQSLNIDAIIVSVDSDFRGHIDYDQFNGGEADFRKFFRTELIPFMEEKYPHDISSRTLVGIGFGARYTLNSMFLEDSGNPVFQKFIANNPYAIGNLVETVITPNDFPQSKSDLKLYVTMANTAADFDIDHIGTIFLSNYPWLTAEYEEFPNLNHEAIVEPGFTAGLRFIFAED